MASFTHIFQNLYDFVFFYSVEYKCCCLCDPQKEERHSGFKQHEGKYFLLNFVYVYMYAFIFL